MTFGAKNGCDCAGLEVHLETPLSLAGDSAASVGLQCVCVLPSYVMNCSWSAPEVNSAYRLFYESLKYEPGKTRREQVQWGQNWLLIARDQLIRGNAYSVWLEVQRADGVEASEKINFVVEEIVQPPPPELDPVAVSSSGAVVRWRNPYWLEHFADQSLVCELRYKASEDVVWTQLDLDHEDLSQEDPELTDLDPFTSYEVQARCVPEDGQGFWSEWSSSQTFRTPEAAALGQVDAWRNIHLSENSEPKLHLLWKPLDPKTARGDILSYTVDFWDRQKTAVGNLTCLCYSVPVPAAASYAQVSASNSAGKTQPTTLSLEQADLPSPQEVRVLPAESLGFRVTWTFSPSPGGVEPELYVVEWREEISGELLGWIRCPGGNRSALLKGDFRPREPYLVSVYAVYAQGSNSSAPVQAYIQEGVPSAGPLAVQDQSVSSTISLISWEEIPLAHQHGHLTHYTIYLKSPSSSTPRVYEPIGAGERSYALKDLDPGTSYQLWMSGSTSAGEGDSTLVHEFQTPGALWQVYVAALLSVGFLLLLSVIVVFLKRGWFLDFFRKVLPLWCWERVPDPGHSLVITELDPRGTALAKISHLSISTKPPEEPEILEILEPAPSQTSRPARVVFSDYEKHFLPTQEELQGLT
ncbi:interleukin-27 receptor subunit alpha [Heteronotia binoei]|uniref:interleukin-27 receptor subunit alpha n=1 Tax=Heteronotia binoei TaxID=13085 RepID=UPI00293079DD|nr:interleukin-27 receptor subunit alpha [Heteronotia binoei]